MIWWIQSCGIYGIFLIAVFGLFFTNLWPLPCTQKKVKTAEFVGPLTRNRLLDSAEKLFENKIGIGPESIAIHNGMLYTGLWDGSIIEINGDKMRTVTRVGGSYCEVDKSCGDPLGMRFDKEGSLVVADSRKGLYKVNVSTGDIDMLFSSYTPIDGQIDPFFDDLALASNGDIYISDSSHSWHGGTPQWHLLHKHKPDGRLLHYNAKTNQVSVILEKLYFPNGIELSPDEEFLVFTQTLDQDVKKFYLKGAKKGQVETLIDNLPGFPDNIRISSSGTYWLAMVMPRVPEEPSVWEQLAFCHVIRYFLFSSLDVIEYAVDFVRRYFPHDVLAALSYAIRQCQLHSVSPIYGLVLEINNNGEILRSLHSPDGYLSFISQATEYEGTLYLGSCCKPNLAKLKIQ